MSWVFLVIAGCLEVFYTTTMRFTEGFTRFWPSLITWIGITLSLIFVARAAEQIPLGTAYVVWAAIGSVGTILIGIVWFGEPVAFWRMLLLAVIVAATLGLRYIES